MDRSSKTTWAVLVARWWNGQPYVGYRSGSRDATLDEMRLVVTAMPRADKLSRDEEFEVRVCGTSVVTARTKMAS